MFFLVFGCEEHLLFGFGVILEIELANLDKLCAIPCNITALLKPLCTNVKVVPIFNFRVRYLYNSYCCACNNHFFILFKSCTGSVRIQEPSARDRMSVYDTQAIVESATLLYMQSHGHTNAAIDAMYKDVIAARATAPEPKPEPVDLEEDIPELVPELVS